MYNNNNASDPKNGYRFQDAVSLYVFVTNIHNNIEKINPEGPFEDIELYFQDGTCSLFQAKHNKHVNEPLTSKKLKKSISVLLNDVIDNSKISYELKDLVIVTNSNIPFGQDSNSGFSGDYIKTRCKELSKKEFAKIERQINNVKDDIYNSHNNDTVALDSNIYILGDKLSIMKLYYFGDDDESRFKQIYKMTDELIIDMGLKGQNRTLIKYWKDLFGDTSTKEDRVVTKEKFAAYTEMVAMQSLSDNGIDELLKELDIDRENKEYIKDKYTDELEEFSNDLTLKRLIENEYINFRKKNMDIKSWDMFLMFVNNKYEVFMEDLGLDSSDDGDCQLARFIVASVVDNLKKFKKIEKVLINEN